MEKYYIWRSYYGLQKSTKASLCEPSQLPWNRRKLWRLQQNNCQRVSETLQRESGALVSFTGDATNEYIESILYKSLVYQRTRFSTGILLWNTTFRVAKKVQTTPFKLKKADLKLNWQAYAATTGASQPSAFNFLRYALILRSLLNWL